MPRGIPRKVKIYGIFKDGECIFKGSRLEVAEHFGLKPYSLYDYVYPKKKKLFRRYVVRRIDPTIKEEPVIKLSKKEKEIASIVNEFKKETNYTHNTLTMFDPTPYFPDLYDMGYDCRIVGIYNNTDGRIVSKQHRNNDVHYVIEYVTERV